MTTNKTPDDLAIRRRDYQFGREAPHRRWWHSGDPVPTAFYNALSALFPLGERFFMDSVKAFRHKTDGLLKQQVADFLYQEAMHTREHVVFNRMATDAGYDMGRLEGRAGLLLGWARKRWKLHQLCATTALEHFTAMLAAAVLSQPQHLKGMPAEAEQMWRWHAMEEIEHKGVAFDTYMAATARMWKPFVWVQRASVMAVATVLFIWAVTLNLRDLFRQDGINNARTWLRLIGYVFGKGGLGRAILRSYFDYYRPGFHPWDEDDRPLLAQAERMVVRPAAA